MPLDRLQCPSCGAPVTAEGRDSFFCSYCGAKLRVTTGASGNTMAVLDGIRQDAALLAKRAAYQHLVEELQARRLELNRLDEAWKARLGEAGGCTGFLHYRTGRNAIAGAILALLGTLALPLGGAERAGILLVTGVAIVTWIAWQQQHELALAHDEYSASRRKCQEKVALLERDTSGLRAEIDGLIGDLKGSGKQ